MSWFAAIAVTASCVLLAACSSGIEKSMGSMDGPYQENNILPGDVVQITFPGATNWNTVVKVPLNGDIPMQDGDAVNAIGKSPQELQAELLEKFGPQLVQKEIDVTVVESGAVIYVTGAVLAPSQVPMTRALTAYDAIMAAGGPIASSAKLDSVTIVRDSEGVRSVYRIDLTEIISGKNPNPFYLKPFDKILVPQRRFNF